mgnify:CR=1 FL=1
MRRSFNPWLIVMLIILAIFVFNQFGASGTPREINFSTFTTLVDELDGLRSWSTELA